MSGAQRGAILAAPILAVLTLRSLISAHGTYDGRIVPFIRTRQRYYQYFYKNHDYYAGLFGAPFGAWGVGTYIDMAAYSSPAASKGQAPVPVWCLLSGRSEEGDPSPRCCVAEDCLQRGHRQRHAVVSALRTDSYLPLLQVRPAAGCREGSPCARCI